MVLANSTQFGLVQPALTGLEVAAPPVTGSVLSNDTPRPSAAARPAERGGAVVPGDQPLRDVSALSEDSSVAA